jgi:hypothetical protein
MDNVNFITETYLDGTSMEFAIIDRGNGEFTSMTKEHYEAQQAVVPPTFN